MWIQKCRESRRLWSKNSLERSVDSKIPITLRKQELLNCSCGNIEKFANSDLKEACSKFKRKSLNVFKCLLLIRWNENVPRSAMARRKWAHTRLDASHATTTNIDLFVTNLVCITLVPEWNVKGSPTPISVELCARHRCICYRFMWRRVSDILGMRIKDQCFQKKSCYI